MTERPSYVVGLAVAAGMWFSAIVAFLSGILLASVSAIVANVAALLVFSALIFTVGLKSGRQKSSANWITWGIAGAGWVIPWMCGMYFIEGLSEDLGGVFRSIVVVALILIVIPASLIRLGVRRVGARG